MVSIYRENVEVKKKELKMAKSTTEKLHSRKLAKVIVLQKDFEQCIFVHAKLFGKELGPH